MTVADRFNEYFLALNAVKPYRWQRELVAEVAETGTWPDIAAPTGSGKSAIIDAHIFLVAEHAAYAQIARPPRRLVLVAPRRVLVDDQYARALEIARRLHRAQDAEDGVLSELARTLAALKLAALGNPEPPIGVWMLRGGTRPDTGWRREPAACQIICATPQMWGSRLLLRGYGASSRSRNVEAGLLGQDTVAVIDEAHLHMRLVETARAVGGLDRGPARLQVAAMSATQPPAPGQRGVGEEDLDDAHLRDRVQAVKVLQLVDVPGGERELHRALAEHARAARERVDRSAGTIGVFVNAVASALAVADELKGDGKVVVVCGRLRTADLEARRRDHPGLLSLEGDASVEFLVTTQSLEVGVDLDLPGMVTVAAPANAIAQRAGRLNRSGRYSELAPTLTVLTPVNGDRRPDRRGRWLGPYSPEEIEAARDWLQALDGSISPWDVTRSEMPVPVRPPLPRLRRIDLETLAMTSDPLSADPEVDLYLEDPGRELVQVSVIARRHLDGELDPLVVEAMLLASPPRPHEIAMLGFGRALDRILEVVRASAWVLRNANGELHASPLAGLERPLGAGDTLVVSDGAPICTSGVLGLGESGGARDRFDDVLTQDPSGRIDRIVRLSGAAVEPITADDPILGSRLARRRLADLGGDSELVRALRAWRLADLELVWCGAGEEQDGLLVARDMRRDATAVPQIVNPEPVLLSCHQDEVRARLSEILDALRFGEVMLPSERLLAAAAAHDAGKAHPRFQRRMGATDQALAKPRPGHRPDRGDGWRHEQLSAAYAAARSDGDPIAVTVVAAHHGCGRPLFHQRESELLDNWEGCEEGVRAWVARLYGDGGEYEELRGRAQREYGVHGLSWLEALLCCADRQVSAEGR